MLIERRDELVQLILRLLGPFISTLQLLLFSINILLHTHIHLYTLLLLRGFHSFPSYLSLSPSGFLDISHYSR